MVLFFYVYTTFREMLVKSEYYFDPFRTTIIILASICIATFLFTFLFINGDKKKRIAISISSVFIICIIYFLLLASDTRDSYILFISIIIFELEVVIFNGMKKYMLLLVVTAIPLLIFLGNILTAKPEKPNPELSLMQISMVIDLPRFLDQIATNKDEKFDSLISKLKSTNDQETNKDYFFSLPHAANKQNIELKKYFRVGEFSNELIITELRNILNSDLNRDSSTFYSRMLVSGADDIKINSYDQSGFNVYLIIDSTRSSNRTVIITTHYIAEAEKSDCCGLMKNGALLIEDKPQNIFKTFGVKNLEEAFLELCLKENTEINNNNLNDERAQCSREIENNKVVKEDIKM